MTTITGIVHDEIPKVQAKCGHWENTAIHIHSAPVLFSKNIGRVRTSKTLMAPENEWLWTPGETIIASTRKHLHHGLRKEESPCGSTVEELKFNTSILQGTVRLIPTQVLGAVSLCRPKGNLVAEFQALGYMCAAGPGTWSLLNCIAPLLNVTNPCCLYLSIQRWGSKKPAST